MTTLLYAFFGGLLPAIIWLYFLLKEDSRCPEPRHMILLAFFCGMIVVPFVINPEHLACDWLATVKPVCGSLRHATLELLGLKVVFSWAAIEEILKYAVAAVLIFPRKWVDEAPDYVIYMLTVALGFAAGENMLFLYGSTSFTSGLVTDNLRFLGANLLHVLASSVIGFALAFSYLKPAPIRVLYASVGLILAITLHAVFNALMMDASGGKTLSAFLLVWSAAVVFFALFEILKYFRYRRLAKNTC